MEMEMKFLILFSMLFVLTPLMAAESVDSNDSVKAEKNNAFKGLFYTVWNKFKAISPKSETRLRNVTVTMGVRGAETTSTILQPYWKGDKTSDEQFMKQLEDFAQAQSMADNGAIENANQAFSGFVNKYPQSDLKPNAQFAEALTMGAMGNAAKSNISFKTFIDENPSHPLVSEAKLLMQELK